MQLEQFIAHSAQDAAEQIRQRLGPEAVVVSVKQLPARWFGKPQIEVMAHVPEKVTPEPPTPAPAIEIPRCAPNDNVGVTHRLLKSLGLLPVYAERIIERAGAQRPAWLADDLKSLREAMAQSWTPCGPAMGGLHAFVGPAGAGKTTVLCKWLTLEVLLRGRSARVWRLDGETANTAEALSVYGDVLGVPVERSWSGESFEEEIGFVDGPATMPGALVHLVLNGAYESSALVAQARAFAASAPVADIIVTHLDEEPRLGKLWNLALGTGFPIRFLSAGQNIPGEFAEADPERVLARVFPAR